METLRILNVEKAIYDVRVVQILNQKLFKGSLRQTLRVQYLKLLILALTILHVSENLQYFRLASLTLSLPARHAISAPQVFPSAPQVFPERPGQRFATSQEQRVLCRRLKLQEHQMKLNKANNLQSSHLCIYKKIISTSLSLCFPSFLFSLPSFLLQKQLLNVSIAFFFLNNKTRKEFANLRHHRYYLCCLSRFLTLVMVKTS